MRILSRFLFVCFYAACAAQNTGVCIFNQKTYKQECPACTTNQQDYSRTCPCVCANMNTPRDRDYKWCIGGDAVSDGNSDWAMGKTVGTPACQTIRLSQSGDGSLDSIKRKFVAYCRSPDGSGSDGSAIACVTSSDGRRVCSTHSPTESAVSFEQVNHSSSFLQKATSDFASAAKCSAADIVVTMEPYCGRWYYGRLLTAQCPPHGIKFNIDVSKCVAKKCLGATHSPTLPTPPPRKPDPCRDDIELFVVINCKKKDQACVSSCKEWASGMRAIACNSLDKAYSECDAVAPGDKGQKDKGGLGAGVIVGIIIGCVIVIAAIAIGLLVMKRKTFTKSTEMPTESL